MPEPDKLTNQVFLSAAGTGLEIYPLSLIVPVDNVSSVN